jgi:hypothetical protein
MSPLGSTAVIPSRLWTLEFSSLNFHSLRSMRISVACRFNRTVETYFGSLPKIHRFMPPVLGSDGSYLLWTIRRSMFTSGLYSESTDSCHLFFGSDGSDLLRTIRWSTFTSGLCPESTDSHHLSSGSDGSDLLWPFGASFSSSVLRLFML